MSEQRLQAFRDCGKGLYAEIRDDGQAVRVFSHHCHDRWCIPCQVARGATVARNLQNHLGNRNVTHWIFTLRHSSTPLNDQIDRIKRSFHELRRKALWSNAVKGGAAFLEVKIAANGLWHPHLHVICDARFIEQRALSRLWHSITGDSSYVFVRFFRASERLTSYVTKYMSKPIEACLYDDPVKLREAMLALRSVRSCQTFGDWKSLRLTERQDDGHAWKPLGHVPSLFAVALTGDTAALRHCRLLVERFPALAIFARPPPTSDATGPDLESSTCGAVSAAFPE